MRSILQMLEFNIIRVKFSSVPINITISALPLDVRGANLQKTERTD